LLRRFGGSYDGTPFYAVLRRKKIYNVGSVQGDQKIEKQIRPVFRKVAQKSQSINIKAQFESPKHLHQTTFET
jgi:hypothetical protein